MTAILLDNSRVVPVCPTNTADVVRIVRSCTASLQSAGLHVEDGNTVVEYVVSNLVQNLENVGRGVILLMLQQIELTDHNIPARFKVKMSGVPYGSDDGSNYFKSVEEAVKQTIRRELDENKNMLESNHSTLIESIVLTNEDTASGQISHPNMLTDELEKVVEACLSGKINTGDQVRFLASLEEACLKADRAGATIAAVAIRDIVDGDRKRVKFESFTSDSEEMFNVEKENRRGSETCVPINVRQHDMPR